MLDRTFFALSDPTRRAIIERLGSTDGASVGEIARPFAMSIPGVIKHLDILTEAGLISRTRHGRSVTCRLKPASMTEALSWLESNTRFWTERLDRLAEVAENSDE